MSDEGPIRPLTRPWEPLQRPTLRTDMGLEVSPPERPSAPRLLVRVEQWRPLERPRVITSPDLRPQGNAKASAPPGALKGIGVRAQADAG